MAPEDPNDSPDTAEGSDAATADDESADAGSADERPDEEWEPDEPTRVGDNIVVPMRMYKGITVFSTLLAVFLIVFGFFMFDAATQPQNLVRGAVVWLFGVVGYVPPVGVLDVGFGLLGVALILIGAGSYVLGSRFKTAGMLTDEERPVEDPEE